jgi:hypothetical protein
MRHLKLDRVPILPGRKLACLGFCIILLVACQPTPTPLAPVTPTAPPPSLTPSATIVWFPPTATFTPYPTPLPQTPTPDQRPGIAELILEDDFSKEEAWSQDTSSQGSAAVGGGVLSLVLHETRTYVTSIRSEPVLGDFYLEITANPVLCRGLDEYGLLLRLASAADTYRFSVSCDGQARLDRIIQGQASSPVPWMLSGALPPGAPSVSRLAVWASGRELRFFANDQFLFSVRDPLLTAGLIGVFARSAGNQDVTVNFDDLLIYSLSQPPPATEVIP